MSSEMKSLEIDSDIERSRPDYEIKEIDIVIDNTTNNPLLSKVTGHDFDQQDKSLSFDSRISESKEPLPDLWSRDYIGLYCQYAAVGLIYGSTGTLIPFCAYTFNGPANGESGSNYLYIHPEVRSLTLPSQSQ